MNLFGWTIARKNADTLTLDQFIQRLDAIYQTVSGIQVTPDTAMESPTVHAIVQAISGTISTLPVHVQLESVDSKGRVTTEVLRNHPVERLLQRPNDIQDRVTYWLDAASWLVRYGNHYAYKARGITGPIRRLDFMEPSRVCVHRRQEDGGIEYRVTKYGGEYDVYQPWEMHHARGPARNGYVGDSPVMDVREAIAMEIAAERFGGNFFGNGAMPGLVFKYAETFKGHNTPQQKQAFLDELQRLFTSKGRFKSMLLPRGIEMDSLDVDNEKTQFLDTRKHIRTVIAGALNVPPHIVGDLERGTFSNIEHQQLEWFKGPIVKYCRIFESAMERDLLTPADRASGVVIRFNQEGALRGDFKTRQEGLNIQRQAGVITANEWRELEGRNPLPDGQGGDDVYQQGPSGQTVGGKKPANGGSDATGTA